MQKNPYSLSKTGNFTNPRGNQSEDCDALKHKNKNLSEFDHRHTVLVRNTSQDIKVYILSKSAPGSMMSANRKNNTTWTVMRMQHQERPGDAEADEGAL